MVSERVRKCVSGLDLKMVGDHKEVFRTGR
jgi:hypothetical protein